MTIFYKGKTTVVHMKAIFSKIAEDDSGIVRFYVSPSIDEQCRRRSEAAKRGWEKRRARKSMEILP